MKYLISAVIVILFATTSIFAQSKVEVLRNILIQNKQKLDSIYGEDFDALGIYLDSIRPFNLANAEYPINEILKQEELNTIVKHHPAICSVTDGGIAIMEITKKQNDFPFELIQVQSKLFGSTTLIMECYVNGEHLFVSYACGKQYRFEEIKALRQRGANLTDWEQP